jgi:hypothetical protein
MEIPMTNKQPLHGRSVVHMILASATGAPSNIEVPITLDEIAEFVMAKTKAAAAETPAPVAETPAEPAAHASVA